MIRHLDSQELPAVVTVERRCTPERRTMWRGGRRDADWLNRPPGALPRLHFKPRAKRVIFLFMAGGPSQLELFDPKPKLQELAGKDLPPSALPAYSARRKTFRPGSPSGTR